MEYVSKKQNGIIEENKYSIDAIRLVDTKVQNRILKERIDMVGNKQIENKMNQLKEAKSACLSTQNS